MIVRQGFRRLARDRRGVTIIEFAFVAPVMLLLLMGLGDIVYRAYMQAVLEGAMQKAGRDSTLEGSSNQASVIDAAVMNVVTKVSKRATYTSSRKSYSTYSSLDPEPFTDGNGNKTRDAGECFDDLNGNKAWDSDLSKSGQGNANDVVLYQMIVTYPRVFPLFEFLGGGYNQVITATTILKNQPYASSNTPNRESICT